jgi:hypothetical protein
MLSLRTLKPLFFLPSKLKEHVRPFKNAAHIEEVRNQLIEYKLIKLCQNNELVTLPSGTPVFTFWKSKCYEWAVPITTNPDPNNLTSFINENDNDPKYLATSNTKKPSDCFKIGEDRYYVDIHDLSLYKEPDPKILEDINHFKTSKVPKII